LRYAEADTEATLVVTELRNRGINAVMITDVPNGFSIDRAVAEAIVKAKLVVIFGTRSYGIETNSPCSTFQELSYIVDKKWNSFFLIKMCEYF
jgi:hypothetical protein